MSMEPTEPARAAAQVEIDGLRRRLLGGRGPGASEAEIARNTRDVPAACELPPATAIPAPNPVPRAAGIGAAAALVLVLLARTARRRLSGPARASRFIEDLS
jgi:hypothetical protein